MKRTAPEWALMFERYERKFPLSEHLWRQAVHCAQRFLPAERFDGVHDRVHIRTVYLDTPGLASYREYVEDAPIRRKIRFRQYGHDGMTDGLCWVEIKLKYHDYSFKRRFRCGVEEATALVAGQDIAAHVAERNPNVDEAERTYRMVREAVLEGDMRPVVRVDYERIAFQEPAGDRARMTLDRQIHFWATGRSVVQHTGLVLEAKFRDDEPHWLPELLHSLDVHDSARFSKYARAIHSLGFNGHG